MTKCLHSKDKISKTTLHGTVLEHLKKWQWRLSETGHRGDGLLRKWRARCTKASAHTSSPHQARDPAGEPIRPDPLHSIPPPPPPHDK